MEKSEGVKHDGEEAEEPAIFSRGALKTVAAPAVADKRRGGLVERPVQETGTFEDLGLADWLASTCKEMGMIQPTPVQRACVPEILAGKDCFGLAQTGSGKTAAFALPILQVLSVNLYGVFALVLTPTRELAIQIAEQFRVLGSGIHLRCAVVIGGMDMLQQSRALMQRPHVVIATPGRLHDLLSSDSDIAGVFAKIKFLVFDEADRLLDVGFEKEIRLVLSSVPSQRQTLLFSATMTSDLQALQELSLSESFVYQAYEGLKTVETLEQKYIFVPASVKEVYLAHLLSSMEEQKVRSVIIFVSSCRTCQLLGLMLEDLGTDVVTMHSMKSQGQRLAALKRFKSGQVPILIATDVASRGLDIPTMDLVINYDIPRFARDYVHRVGRTARAGRGGSAVSLVTQYDVQLIHEIESLIGRQLEDYEVDEDVVLKGMTKVYKAKRAATLKLADTGFEDKLKARKRDKRKLVDTAPSPRGKAKNSER